VDEQFKIPGFKSLTFLADGPYYKLYSGVRIHTDAHHWIQVLNPELADEKKISIEFEGLLKHTPDLHHSNILTPIAYEKIENHFLLIYDTFTGESIQSLLDANTPFVERRVIKIVVKAVRALQHSQMRGKKHGWLNADFIFWSKADDKVKVLGFGSQPIFEIMMQNLTMAVPKAIRNIAPENLSSQKLPESDDSYALGCIFYKLLSGNIPFNNTEIEESKREKRAPLTPPHLVNSKLSEKGSMAAMALIKPEVEDRTNYSFVLDQLDHREDEIDALLDPTPEYKPSIKQRIHGAMGFARPGGLVGSQKRVVYTIIIAMLFLITVGGLFIASLMSAKDDKHLQKVYADFIAESSKKQIEPESAYNENVLLSEHVSNSDNSDDIIEKNENPFTPLVDEESPVIESVSSAAPAKIAPAPPIVEYADMRIEFIGDDQPESARVLINEKFMGLLERVQPLYLQKFDVSRSYKVRIVSADYKPWEKRIRISSIRENNINVTLEPLVESRSIHFERVAFADKIRIDGAVVKNLPCDIEMRSGVHRVIYIDSKSNFSWSTDVTVNGDTPETMSVLASTVGMGEASIVLKNPIQYGYVFVRIDDESDQRSTPLKVRLSAGWHRLRVFRQDYSLSPSDTLIFIRPFENAQIRCKVLN
jgi:serine/threonine protein kinase